MAQEVGSGGCSVDAHTSSILAYDGVVTLVT